MSLKQNDTYIETKKEAQEEKVCSDCGGSGVTVASHAGFNAATGEISDEVLKECLCQLHEPEYDDNPELD